jgi:hypothetical protein
LSEEKGMTAGNWIALLTAVLSLFGVVYSSIYSSRAKELEAQDQLKREHLDAYVAMLSSQEENAKKLGAAFSKDQYYRVSFANDCDRPISVAMQYRDFDGSIVVTGWFSIPEHKSRFLTATRSHLVNLYVKKSAGKPFETSPKLGDYNTYDVTAEPFRYVINEQYKNGWYPLPNKQSKHFQIMDLNETDQTFGERTVSEDCH